MTYFQIKNKHSMLQIHFVIIKEISIPYGWLGLLKKQFNFNKLIGNKPGAYAVKFIRDGNPSKVVIA